jgi:hypothetical protein
MATEYVLSYKGSEIDEKLNKIDSLATKSELPTKISQLENDKGYLTEHQDISGKLDASALPTAINTALAQAKASGEFDGKDGVDGKDGSKGADGKDYVLTEADKAEMVSAVVAALPVYNGEVV